MDHYFSKDRDIWTKQQENFYGCPKNIGETWAALRT
jgi:hypothetical protein